MESDVVQFQRAVDLQKWSCCITWAQLIYFFATEVVGVAFDIIMDFIQAYDYYE